MKKSNGIALVIGVVLIAAGAVAAAYGIYAYVVPPNLAEKAQRLMRHTPMQTRAMAMAVCGGAAFIAGLIAIVSDRRKR